MSDESNSLEPNKKKSSLGKVFAGLVIGGAIGSVLGMAFAPQKGTQTRKTLKGKARKLLEKSCEFLEEHEREIATLKKTSASMWKKLGKKMK